VAEPTNRLGFSTGLLGRNHVRDPNQPISYAFCPPTSGDHIFVQNRGPIRAAVYPANEEQIPGGWVHNLEHGYVVALYRCPSGVIGEGDCINQAEMDQMTAFFNDVPTRSIQRVRRRSWSLASTPWRRSSRSLPGVARS
jgi:hypothetical protein